MHSSVFISYRRDDASAEALLVCNAVRARVGRDAVFFDTSSIEPGTKWPESIQNALQAAETVLVVIGPGWLTAADKYGRRRIDGADDWVRSEVATALREKGAVIPILVRDSQLPPAEALPEDLRALADRQAYSVRRDHLEEDLVLLLASICGPDAPEAPSRRPTAPHEIPAPVSTFVGREAEIERIVERLSGAGSAATVAICGVRGLGGVGKSQLVFAVAERLTERFPDGQIFVDLAGMSEAPLAPDAALRAALRALGAEPAATDDLARLEAAYRSRTHGRRVLVVADDALDGAQVAPLAPGPGCGLVVTSRSRLFFAGMAQEHLVDLGPLSEREAESLLLEICPRVGDAAPRIAALCGRLPLALQVGASLLANDPTLGVDELGALLEDERSRLSALKSLDGPDLDVEAALALSFDRLGPAARSALARASVFPSSFTREAAEAVVRLDANDERATAAALKELYRRSLVEFDAETKRYSLHDLTRVFAAARLSDDARRDARARYVRYFAAALDEAEDLYDEGGEQAREGLRRFDAERVHIETAQRHAVERYRAGEQAFARDCLTFALRGSRILVLRLHPREHVTWLEVAVEAARTLDERGSEGRALGNLGVVSLDLGDARKAIEYFERDLQIARELCDRRSEGMSLGNLGLAYAALGSVHKAIEYYEQNLEIAREVHDRRGESSALGNLGVTYLNPDGARKAIEYFEQDLEITREIRDRRGEGMSLGNLGLAYANLGDVHTAIEYYEQHLVIAQEVSDRPGEAKTSFNLGIALRHLGRKEEAAASFRRAVELFDQIESPYVDDARAMLTALLDESA